MVQFYLKYQARGIYSGIPIKVKISQQFFDLWNQRCLNHEAYFTNNANYAFSIDFVYLQLKINSKLINMLVQELQQIFVFKPSRLLRSVSWSICTKITGKAYSLDNHRYHQYSEHHTQRVILMQKKLCQYICRTIANRSINYY